MARVRKRPAIVGTESYLHEDRAALLRPDIGLQAQFKKKKPNKNYRYDDSLDPQLSWDTNATREKGEKLIEDIIKTDNLDLAKAAADQLKRMSAPFLNWTGKAERSEFGVPTLPLFVHERLSTKAILESVRTHKQQLNLFADPHLDIAERVLGAYEHKTGWVNRLILGDNLQVMNSLLEYEGLGGQVQMIYIDPPYGVKFGSNFQPFVRKRDVKHNYDQDLTREPEMVQAYRDTWELGLHSYLTYLRDRFKVALDLLSPSGSIFVQISDENVHHVREVMDEIFGPENFVALIVFKTATNQNTKTIQRLFDFIIWYSRSIESLKIKTLFRPRQSDELNVFDKTDEDGQIFRPKGINLSAYNKEEIERLIKADRLTADKQFTKRFPEDFPFMEIHNVWQDTIIPTYTKEKSYVVQTYNKVIERCILMTTDPDDLVFDPTCGSGTTSYVAEKWGRRWITADISRVPLALTRQRLLTATYPWYQLRDEVAGLSGGFKYERKQNSKKEEIGGIVPHITLESIAKGDKTKEEVLVDRPNINPSIVRVSGPFVIEATIPTPIDIDSDGIEDSGIETGDHFKRIFEALKKSPIIRLPGNKKAEFKNVREISGSLLLQAEAITSNNGGKLVTFSFGPPSSSISEKQVFEAAREAYAKSYSQIYFLGFACQDTATRFIRDCQQIIGIAAFYVNVTMDLQMEDLLKNQRASQIFSITGSPEIKLIKLLQKNEKNEALYQVELLGLDTFDPITSEVEHENGDNVPCWLLDTDYNDLSFRVCQAFFPRTSAWDNLKRSLKAEFDDSVWDHLAGTVSEPFPGGETSKIAVKVIDDRGNELMLVQQLHQAVMERQRK